MRKSSRGCEASSHCPSKGRQLDSSLTLDAVDSRPRGTVGGASSLLEGGNGEELRLPLIRPHEQRACMALLLLAVVGLVSYRLSFGLGPVVDLSQGRPLMEGRFELDLNEAGWTELALLPGIGMTLAKRIVALRDERGGFGQVDELRDVRGIGEKKLGRIRIHLVIRAESDSER